MSLEWDGKPLEDVISQEQEDGMSVWSFLEHMGAGRLLRVTSSEAFSLALDEVYLEMYHNVLKRVSFFFHVSSLWSTLFCWFFNYVLSVQGYMWKKGHVRRNWTERWFVLKPSSMAYYVSEDLKDKRGEIQLDKSCVVEVGKEMSYKHCTFTHVVYRQCFACAQTACLLATHTLTVSLKCDCWLSLFQPIPDREGKRCMLCVKTFNKTFEMSASDQRQRVEWTQGVLMYIAEN